MLLISIPELAKGRAEAYFCLLIPTLSPFTRSYYHPTRVALLRWNVCLYFTGGRRLKPTQSV